MALGTYRHTVSSVLPNMTRVAWQLKKDEILRALPGVTRRGFVYRLPRRAYRRDFGKSYRSAGVGTHILTFFLGLIPHAGPFRGLGFKVPPQEAEELFRASLRKTVADYGQALAGLRERRSAPLDDINLDTGGPVRRGGYSLEDRAYAQLVERLSRKRFGGIDAQLSTAILTYFGRPDTNPARRDKKAAQLAAWLEQMRMAAGAGARQQGSTVGLSATNVPSTDFTRWAWTPESLTIR